MTHLFQQTPTFKTKYTIHTATNTLTRKHLRIFLRVSLREQEIEIPHGSSLYFITGFYKEISSGRFLISRIP